jgi:hypothetical protein
MKETKDQEFERMKRNAEALRLMAGRDYFQRPRASERPDRSAGWDARPEYSGSSWSGERWSGRNQSGGRDR